MTHIVIIGGGYAGTMLARLLDPWAKVTLIEKRDRFVHNVAAIRAVVDPSLLPSIMLPYDKLLKNGTFRQAAATGLGEGTITLSDGSMLSADYVVVATGSTYALPFKPADNATAHFAAASKAAHAALSQARRVAIIGGGAVGIELAGEIAAGMQGKEITLYAASQNLLPGFNPKLAAALARQLGAMGVTLCLGQAVAGLAATNAPQSGSFTFGGAQVQADLILPAMGAEVTNALLKPLASAVFTAQGRVAVDAWLRPAGLARVFAVGDLAAAGDAMTIVGLSRQVPWLAKTLKALAAGKEITSLPGYAPWKVAPLLVPLGAAEGSSLLPVGAGWVTGAFLTSAIKGRALFIPRYRKEFGLTPAS